MKTIDVLRNLKIEVLDGGFSIPPTDQEDEVMYLRFIAIDEPQKYYNVNVVPHDQASIIDRLIESIFNSQEDLNGDYTLNNTQFIVRISQGEYHKDLNDPRVYIPTRRVSIIVNKTDNLDCSILERDLDEFDALLSRRLIDLVYYVIQ